MAIELITCTACGAKNAEYRTVCLRCGHNLGRAEEESDELRDEVLIEKAKAFAPVLDGIARISVDSVFKELQKEVAVDVRGEVYLETVVFYLHLVSRFALEFLGAEKRNTFLDVLLLEVRELLSRTFFASGLEAERFRNRFAAHWNTRELEYGNYNFFSEKGGLPEGRLLWEFGRKIAGIVSSEENIKEYFLVMMDVSDCVICSVDPILKGIPR